MSVLYCSACSAKVEGSAERCPSCDANSSYFSKTSEKYYAKILEAAAKNRSISGLQGIQRQVEVREDVRQETREEDQKTQLIRFSRKVSSLASTLGGLMVGLGILTIFGGIVIATQSTTLSDGAGYTVSTHPYVGLGIMVVFAGLLESLIFVLLFNYIELQAKYREWQLSL